MLALECRRFARQVELVRWAIRMARNLLNRRKSRFRRGAELAINFLTDQCTDMNSPQTPNWAQPEVHFAQPHAIGASARRPQPLGYSAHVLLIDAHKANLRVLQKVLEESGYAVSIARSLAEALQITVHRRPDLVLMDQDLCSKEGVGLIAPLLN
jgi:hypothetical protein